MLLHNKKGIFIPMFVIFTAVILGVIFYMMYNQESMKNDLVGLRASSLLKAYDEEEKISFYLDLATYYSNNESLRKLAENGGYSESNSCEKTQQNIIDRETYVILNTCSVLNPYLEFKEQLKKEIKNYTSKYQSTYKKTDFQELFDLEKIKEKSGRVPPGVPPESGRTYYEAGDSYNEVYTKNVQEVSILSFGDVGSKILINFSDLILPIENDQLARITLKPRTSVSKPDFSLYRRVYQTLQTNCSQKSMQECKEKLKAEFPEIILEQENNILKVKLSSPQGTIRFALNPEQLIPGYQETP